MSELIPSPQPSPGGRGGVSEADKHIVLLVPGLAGPLSDHPVADYLERRPASLDRFISRSHPEPFTGAGVDEVLLHCFGLNIDTPVAPLTYTVDTGSAPSRYVMRADPVHLHADQSSLRLFEAHSFTLTQDESDTLIDSFNEFYAGSGRQLIAPVPSRWYLELDERPEMTTTPLVNAAGQDIDPLLPQGNSARAWHALLNEVQMLFYEHKVNLVREQRGQPAINSLWPWGGGTMQGTAVNAGVDRVMANDPLAIACAGLAGIETESMPDSAEQILSTAGAGVTLALLDSLCWPARYNEVEAWIDALHVFDERLLAPLLGALAGGSVSSVRLLPCNGTGFTLTRRWLRRFWRRVRPYEQALA